MRIAEDLNNAHTTPKKYQYSRQYLWVEKPVGGKNK